MSPREGGAMNRGEPPSAVSPSKRLLWRAPGRGDFSISNFHPCPIPGNLGETIFGVRKVARAEGGGLFLGYLLGKDIGGVIAIISFRPGGWMQQSAVPRCAILSVGSTGGIGQ